MQIKVNQNPANISINIMYKIEAVALIIEIIAEVFRLRKITLTS